MIVQLTLAAGLAGAPSPAANADGPATVAQARDLDDPVLDTYFAQLKAASVVDGREATLDQVEQVLRTAQDRYVAGNALASAIVLFELTQSPRYVNFEETPQMSSAWYHLGVALASYGAELSARKAFGKVLALGPSDSYFTPALRRQVDLILASKDYVRGFEQLKSDLKPANRPPHALGSVDLDEQEYLQARAQQQAGDLDGALATYAAVSPRSRFHTAALYLSGVIYAGRGQFRKAESAFCDVVGGPNQRLSAYYVDRRYFAVRDLAQLGLGRVAHEERRHGHAFYHYFSVPQDSPELPQALFEAAWTMAEQGEYAVARGLIGDLRDRFPHAPQTMEARVLDALLKLYDCDFRVAEKEFAAFIDEMAPVSDHIDEIRKSPERTRALHRELVTVRRSGDKALDGDTQAHRLLLAMMDEDPSYARLTRRADVLRSEARFGRALDSQLQRLQAQLQGTGTAVSRTSDEDLLGVLAQTKALERGVAGLERQLRRTEAAGADPQALAKEHAEVAALRTELAKLRSRAGRLLVDAPAVGQAQTADLYATIDADRRRISRLRAESEVAAAKLDDQAARAAAARLGHLRTRLDNLMGEARMGRIDAVLGAKKKLEIEVQDMAAGRFPPELFGKLQIEGMVGDDEEFWPYEGEYWSDEYEGYR